MTTTFATTPIAGSVRGSGEILVGDDSCGTGITGLWVAGDAASREMLVGASSGAGSVNASWALSSGRWAGTAAAGHARQQGEPQGGAALWEARSGTSEFSPAALLAALQAKVLPLSRNGFRTAASLSRTLETVAGVGAALGSARLSRNARQLLKQRELLSMARRAAKAALIRSENRGVHVRPDLEAIDPPEWRQRLVWDGTADQPRRLDIQPFHEAAAA